MGISFYGCVVHLWNEKIKAEPIKSGVRDGWGRIAVHIYSKEIHMSEKNQGFPLLPDSKILRVSPTQQLHIVN